jgi:UDP-3-O-[3-hydroxymyristoyl] N-acetylglucosamine deacetylase
MSLKPARAGRGIRFRRADLGGIEIPATVDNVDRLHYATALSRDTGTVETVEHLLAALVSLGVDNVIVELNQPEVPIMDGSAASFVYLVHEAGLKRLTRPRRYLKVLHPVSLTQGEKSIALYPAEHFKVTYTISFDHPLLRHMTHTLRVTQESFVDEIAPARTFGFLKEVEMLRKKGLALGGSLDNAVVLGETGILNNALRFDDEFVRHKILDAIGDLAHAAFAEKFLQETDAWQFVESPSVAEADPIGEVSAVKAATPVTS